MMMSRAIPAQKATIFAATAPEDPRRTSQKYSSSQFTIPSCLQ